MATIDEEQHAIKAAAEQGRTDGCRSPSYSDITIETALIPERPLRYDSISLRCCRVGGWELWDESCRPAQRLAGEFEDNWLIVKVNGIVIVDSKRTRRLSR